MIDMYDKKDGLATNIEFWYKDASLFTEDASIGDKETCLVKCYDDATCNSAEWRYTPIVAEVAAVAAIPPAPAVLAVPAKAETKTCRLWKKGGLAGTGTAATGGSINETYHKKTDKTPVVGDILHMYDEKDGLATGIAMWYKDSNLFTEEVTTGHEVSCLVKCYDDATCNSMEWRLTAAVVAVAAVPPAAEILAKAETKTCRYWKKGGLVGTGITATGGAENKTYHKKTDKTPVIVNIADKFNEKAGPATSIKLYTLDTT